MSDKMEKSYQAKINAYRKIIQVYDEHEATISPSMNAKKDLLNEVSRLHLCILFGIDLPLHNSNWCSLSKFEIVGLFPPCEISWPDTHNHPENEWLYGVKFPEGPYSLGEHYPKKYFNAMFDELRGLGPAFVDSHNNSLYFRPPIIDLRAAVSEIINRYKSGAAENYKAMRAEELRAELALLDADQGGN